MELWKGKVAAVTGGNSPLGSTIVMELAKAGINVVGLADNPQDVEDLKKIVPQSAVEFIHSCECDVANEISIKKAFQWIEHAFGTCHILINNAAIVRRTFILTDDDSNDDLKDLIDTNLYGVVVCIREIYKLMKKYSTIGYIININSVVGHEVPMFTIPVANIYPGTKHAVTATSEIIRQELNYFRNNKVRISVSITISNLSSLYYQ